MFGFKKRAEEKFYPIDETLRLVLSGEERDFISLTIQKQKIKIILCVSYIIIFIAVFYGSVEFSNNDAADQYAKYPAGSEPDEYYATGGLVALVIAGLATPVAAAQIFESIFRLIKFSRYRRDHRAFLRKHDRERLY